MNRRLMSRSIACGAAVGLGAVWGVPAQATAQTEANTSALAASASPFGSPNYCTHSSVRSSGYAGIKTVTYLRGVWQPVQGVPHHFHDYYVEITNYLDPSHPVGFTGGKDCGFS